MTDGQMEVIAISPSLFLKSVGITINLAAKRGDGWELINTPSKLADLQTIQWITYHRRRHGCGRCGFCRTNSFGRWGMPHH